MASPPRPPPPAFAAPGAKAPADFQLSLFLPEARTFVLAGGYAFALDGYAYDDWMDLRYFGRVDLV